MRAVELKGLTYTYSVKTPFEKRALDNVSLAVEEGEFVGLIGATGSGKSTLIQHLNGLVKVQQGEVSVEGMNASDKKTLKKLRFTVGMVFQYPEYQLFEDTVAKDVAFGPKNMKLDKEEVERRVRRAMEVVGLPYEEFAERSPFELSGGEKRRAAIVAERNAAPPSRASLPWSPRSSSWTSPWRGWTQWEEGRSSRSCANCTRK